MQFVLNGAEMKACDGTIINHFGVPSLVLMERAALSVVEEIMKRFPDAGDFLVVCGSGNNGGDGIAAARLLYLKGKEVHIAFIGNEEKASAETKTQLSIARNYEIPVFDEIPDADYDVILDSIFGIGLCRDVTGCYAQILAHMNAMRGKKVAVDISSGISADSGQVLGTAFRADLTVSFGFPKIGHLLYPGAEYTGELAIKDIGINEWGFPDDDPQVMAFQKTDLGKLPARRADSNKGTFGRVLVIAGSVNMAGAACFSAAAAYRCGAGLVRVLTPEENRVILQCAVPEAVLTTYDAEKFEAKKVSECLRWADVIVIGPGIGTDRTAAELTEYVLRETNRPCIADADALNLIAAEHFLLHPEKGTRILTPHPGEMARLTGRKISDIRADLLNTAREYAAEQNVILVLKDARTVTARADGRIYINRSGNHGMATGGSGDVLTGILAGLIAQGSVPEEAVPLGVYLHGLAGDAAAEKTGKRSLTASGLLDGLAEVLKTAEKR